MVPKVPKKGRKSASGIVALSKHGFGFMALPRISFASLPAALRLPIALPG